MNKNVKSALVGAAAILILTILGIALVSTVLRLPSFPGKAPGISVDFTGSSYRAVDSRPGGWFRTGQEADILLSGVDFNNAGGPLLFNHPGNIASDGTRLVMADRNNNRILVWNSLPTADNQPPDIVLGQGDFRTNNPGTGLDQMNWPIGIAMDGTHLLVTDVENDRVLVWNRFPTRNGQPADLVLGGIKEDSIDKRGAIVWPWAVWTNGEKVVVTSTPTYQALVWTSFPTRDNQPPDLTIRLPDRFGTPRSIGSDGVRLAIGDHNAFHTKQGTFFWKTFPTREDQEYDFFMADPGRIGQPEGDPWLAQGEVLWGMTFTPEGTFLGLTNRLNVWDSFPEHENDAPDLAVGVRRRGTPGYDFGGAQSGDGSGIALAGDRLYISLHNGNKIVGYSSLPTAETQLPDLVIGSPDIDTNTLQTEFIISNPVPLTDGKSLVVLSDFDGKMYVWKQLPDESGAKPDIVYHLPVTAGVLFNGMLAVVGRDTVHLWKSLPLQGESPDRTFFSIGNVQFQDLRGVAMDDRYFYLSDMRADKIYVWEGFPEPGQNPRFTLSLETPIRLYSDGTYLLVTSNEDRPGGSVRIYDIATLSSDSQPRYLEWGGRFNGPGHAILHNGSLFVADGGFHRVLVWNTMERALAGSNPDVILGAQDLEDTDAEIGRSSLFLPYSLAFDGSFLWVGEVKFSERLLRFSVQ